MSVGLISASGGIFERRVNWALRKVVHSRSFAKYYPELTVERGHPNVWGLNAKEKESLTILSFSQFQKFAWCLILNLRHQIPHEC